MLVYPRLPEITDNTRRAVLTYAGDARATRSGNPCHQGRALDTPLPVGFLMGSPGGTERERHLIGKCEATERQRPLVSL